MFGNDAERCERAGQGATNKYTPRQAGACAPVLCQASLRLPRTGNTGLSIGSWRNEVVVYRLSTEATFDGFRIYSSSRVLFACWTPPLFIRHAVPSTLVDAGAASRSGRGAVPAYTVLGHIFETLFCVRHDDYFAPEMSWPATSLYPSVALNFARKESFRHHMALPVQPEVAPLLPVIQVPTGNSERARETRTEKRGKTRQRPTLCNTVMFYCTCVCSQNSAPFLLDVDGSNRSPTRARCRFCVNLTQHRRSGPLHDQIRDAKTGKQADRQADWQAGRQAGK